MILITEFMDEPAVDTLRAAFEVIYDPSLADTQEKIPALLESAKALIVRNRTQVTEDLLKVSPRLTCIGRLGVGLDNIDQKACAKSDVTVYPASGANDLSVAEYVITSAMMLMRNAYQSKHQMLGGDWPRAACAGREICGKTLGLVGFGAIAQRTAGLARAVGMQIAAFDPYLPAEHSAWEGVNKLQLDHLLAISDVVSLHTPLTPQTRHLIDAEHISMMKPDAILINAARGGVVDEAALAAALSTGRLGGAALDVFETEPMTRIAGAQFKGLANILVTPHIAGVTVESNQRVSALISDKVLQHLNSVGRITANKNGT
ncbi:MAG: hydroxyacid dehydrogenase [Hyphomicrobiales bacterium]|nr:hydroxyacid dehydrogenase [Hyphomicrobiales bacterium]